MNNSTSNADYSTLLLINRIVYRDYFLFLIMAGTCGNLLTAVTLLRAKLRKYTTCQFMAVCAVLNTGVLLTNTLNLTFSLGYGIHVRSLYDLGWCRLNVFIAQWIRGLASWFLVIVAFDRFRQSKTIRRIPARKNPMLFYSIFIAGFILLILNVHYLLFLGQRVSLDNQESFLACIFHKNSLDPVQRFFAKINMWQELVTIIIIPCILTLILNIFIIKNSFLNPVNNEQLKSRSKSRTRRVTTMLLASSIGFLALVAPAQIFNALLFDPDRRDPAAYISFMIRGNIFQCFINTYYGASFVFCFASSSIFRREIKKLLHRQYKAKHILNRAISGPTSSHEVRPFILHAQVSTANCSSCSRINEYVLERTNSKRATQSTSEGQELHYQQ
ncbi:unnamed protein product [Adineta steineri]|uniref:G-protein coupled receptors family 1 profile domain-containing protein n=1 Tax=Adineta steineri TaxID=433720 RepID=A0A818MS26_9BILA|nr:unnamed protein product [Adineta steineri]CAF3593772.1 unnamed protein product [Adineta steineri]